MNDILQNHKYYNNETNFKIIFVTYTVIIVINHI